MRSPRRDFRALRSSLPAALFLLLSLCVTYRALAGQEMFYFRDLLSHHVPHLAHGARLWGFGEAPLWSPLFDCGQPHLANPQNLALHPLQVLYLFLPPERAFAAALTLLFWLCGAAMYACARGLGAPVGAALAAGAAYQLSGFVLSLGNLANLLAAAAPLPLTFLFAMRAAAALGGPQAHALRERALRAARPLAAAGALFALQVLGGEPFVAALCLAAIAAVLPAVGGGGARRRLGGAAAVAAGMALLAALIDAAVILPAAAFFPDTVRAWGFRPQAALLWSMRPLHLIEMLVPGVFGDPVGGGSGGFWGAPLFDRGRAFILGLGMPKVALLAAAAVLCAAFSRRAAEHPGLPAAGEDKPAPSGAGAAPAFAQILWSRRLARTLAWVAASFTLLAWGRHALLRPEWLGGVSALPLLRYPVRFFLVPTFALALLAAFGLEALARGAQRAIWGRVCLAGCGALALLASVCGVLTAGGSIPPVLGRGVAAALARSALALGGLTLALLLPERRGFGPGARAAALVALAALEPLWVYAHLNPTGPRELLARTPPAVEVLRADPDSFRIWRDNSPPLEGLPAHEAPFLAHTAWFRDSLHPSYGLEFDLAYAFNTSGDESDSKRTFLLGKRLAVADLETRARILGIAGVKYLLAFGPPPRGTAVLETHARLPLAGPDLWIWRNHGWLPRARLVERAFAAPDPGQALDRLLSREHDPRAEVILEDAPAQAGPAYTTARMTPTSATSPSQTSASATAAAGSAPSPAALGGSRASAPVPAGAVELVPHTPTHLEIRARSARPAWLVLGDRFAPGWEARGGGSEPMRIQRAEYLLSAMPIPAGDSTIHLTYRPAAFRAGAWISLLGLALAALLAALGRRRPRLPEAIDPGAVVPTIGRNLSS